MLVHSLASKYARFVVIVRQMYWTPPPLQTIGPPPLLKSDDLFFREPRDIGPPLSKILDTPLAPWDHISKYSLPSICSIIGSD